jgi:uracil-DNA glycosylase family 4
MLDDSRARLWRSLGLGPIWVQRDITPSTDAGGAASDAAATAAGTASMASMATEDIAQRASAPLARSCGPDPACAAAEVDSLDWDGLEASVAACTRCALSRTRTQTVFGVGSRQAPWLVVGEAPGAEEDARGEPFVGQAGRLLDRMLDAAGLTRSGSGDAAVYIANVLKCRPPGNRNPEPDEVRCCEPYLRRQIELLAPRLILVMGRFAAQSLLGSEASIAALRGRAHPLVFGGRSVPVVVTYHPAYLLRNLADKAKVWADLCLAREVSGRQLG